jgi:D-citramalate synthase
MDALQNEKIVRFMIADTLGILNHEQAHLYCSEMIERYPELHFDFHAHNDYDLAAANVYSALKAGVKGIHTTVNGLGERAGNVPLSSVIGIVNDHLGMMTSINEAVLSKISTMVETFSGIRIPSNKPIIGENVFTQTCGVHADGDSKANLYFNNLEPERFGRTRQYALGKTSGKANIKKNLQAVGLSLDEESLKKVTKRIIELGDRKEYVTKEDLPYIVSDVLNNGEMSSPIVIKNYSLSLAKGLRPVANISIEINNKSFEESAIGDGQYDAFMKALWKIYASLNREHPVLVDYVVNIPPGGKTDALVDTMITWSFRGRVFKTRAVEADQTEAAIKATQKMLNIIENYYTEDEIKNS